MAELPHTPPNVARGCQLDQELSRNSRTQLWRTCSSTLGWSNIPPMQGDPIPQRHHLPENTTLASTSASCVEALRAPLFRDKRNLNFIPECNSKKEKLEQMMLKEGPEHPFPSRGTRIGDSPSSSIITSTLERNGAHLYHGHKRQ
ncbi:hypothetical protein AV530_007859 [Patagioenas fasciata monilis]|uniref:Uncharacterized protein n=1 Tax=Patagioenas fasciata monilis TaxID=372326 RepID=A0A1V4JTJ1_PATFA|nr:hypothetical protein AV530_007859 [Patagioenas fasciata monilis]